MRTHRFVLPLTALLAMASPAWAASAEDQAAAEALFQDAKKLAAAGDFATACPKFAESQRLDPGSGTALHLAACYEKQDKLASAWATFREAEMMARNTNNSVRQTEAARRAELLAPRLAKLTIVVSPGARVPGFVLRRDGSEVGEGQWGSSLPTDTGQHTVEATAPGYKAWSTVLRIERDGSAASIEVPALDKLPAEAATPPAALPPPAPVPPFAWTPQRIVGVTLGVAGVAGLGVGAAVGLVAMNKANALKSGGQCNADLSACSSTGLTLRQDVQTFAHGSTAGFVIGGAALAAGVVLFATAGTGDVKAPQASGARVIVGPVAGRDMTGLLVRGGW
jgi:hypothetical protein